ncbi:alpha/beta fold hydrolase [Saccharomonospora sp. CUA-673]|uniref:alpha/beta fold hydrolase n=1 Tax=Saccharomonospora sp. CUA-673 TaxID=1904969 RepID=UPI00130125EF|nr:hypothetical protein [Saccharomonospora sp. CUA-673]
MDTGGDAHEPVGVGDPLDEWLAGQLPKAKTVPFASSGHAPFSEEPDRFNEGLGNFAS